MKPYIICHMTMSIDGKVTGDFLTRKECEKAIEWYYEMNREIQSQGFICGRVTMEESFTRGFQPDLKPFENQKVLHEDFIANHQNKRFAVAFDRFGKLGWVTSQINDDDPGYDNTHIIEVLTQQVSDAYLAYLQSIGVSYIFAGDDDLDIQLSLEKLNQYFGIETLLLEGGSVINGAFYHADMIDELSLIVVPLIADKDDKPLFMKGYLNAFEYVDSKVNQNNIWLNYKKCHN